MRMLVARYGDDIAEGDIFIANDPHVAGGTHLPDINMAMPVFADGRLVGFVCNIAHHADIGGIAPRLHGGRHVGDLPGGPAHPGDAAVSRAAS